MAITKHEGRTGGKFCKWPRRRFPSTPYDRPSAAACGTCPIPMANEAGGSGWFSKFVHPAVGVIVRSVSRFFSSVFGPGHNINTIEDVPEVIYSTKVRGQGGNSIDIRLSICYDGNDTTKQELISRIDAIFRCEELLNKKRFSRVEIDHLHSRIIGPSTLPITCYKNEEKISNDSNINPSSSHQVVRFKEKEEGINVNICEKGFESPIEIDKAYMSSKPRMLSVIRTQSKIWHKDKTQDGNKPVNSSNVTKSALCFSSIPADSQNIYMTPKQPRKSTMYKLACSPYFRSSLTNSRDNNLHKDSKVEPTRTLKWATSPLNIRHFGHRQALKRNYSDRDDGCSGDARRVRQKPYLNDLNWLTHADTSSFFLRQEQRQSIDLKGPNNLDCKTHFESVLNAPPHSMEIARKILHELDKL